MPELQEKEIELISVDIEKQGLTFTPLRNELLDHICCEIEIEMEHGMTFNNAYRKVRERMGQRRIRKIQDETLTLISKKYRRMKRIMYGLGIAAPILLISAAIFKVFHWPGASLLVTLALFIIGMVFLPVFVMVRIRDTRRQDEPVPMRLYLTGVVFGMLSILGALFKVQHWPGAGWMLTIGLTGTALLFLPMYAIHQIRSATEEQRRVKRRLWIGGTVTGVLLILGALFKIMHWPGAGIVILVSWSLVAVVLIPLLVLSQLRQNDNRVGNFFMILLVSVAVSVFFLALSRTVPDYYNLGYFMLEDNFLGSAHYYDSKNEQAFQVSAADLTPDLIEFRSVTYDLASYILSVRKELVEMHTWEDSDPYMQNGLIDMREMYWVGKTGIPYQIIVERDSNKLMELMSEFQLHAKQLAKDEDLLEYLETQLSFNRPDDWVEDRWLEHHFQGPLMHSIAILDSYLETVRFVLYEIFKESTSYSGDRVSVAVMDD